MRRLRTALTVLPVTAAIGLGGLAAATPAAAHHTGWNHVHPVPGKSIQQEWVEYRTRPDASQPRIYRWSTAYRCERASYAWWLMHGSRKHCRSQGWPVKVRVGGGWA